MEVLGCAGALGDLAGLPGFSPAVCSRSCWPLSDADPLRRSGGTLGAICEPSSWSADVAALLRRRDGSVNRVLPVYDFSSRGRRRGERIASTSARSQPASVGYGAGVVGWLTAVASIRRTSPTTTQSSASTPAALTHRSDSSSSKCRLPCDYELNLVGGWGRWKSNSRTPARPISTRFGAGSTLEGAQPLVHLRYAFRSRLPGPRRLAVPASSRRCQGCSRPPLHLQDQAALSFTGLLRQPGEAGLSPPSGHMAPRGAPARMERVETDDRLGGVGLGAHAPGVRRPHVHRHHLDRGGALLAELIEERVEGRAVLASRSVDTHHADASRLVASHATSDSKSVVKRGAVPASRTPSTRTPCAGHSGRRSLACFSNLGAPQAQVPPAGHDGPVHLIAGLGREPHSHRSVRGRAPRRDVRPGRRRASRRLPWTLPSLIGGSGSGPTGRSAPLRTASRGSCRNLGGEPRHLLRISRLPNRPLFTGDISRRGHSRRPRQRNRTHRGASVQLPGGGRAARRSRLGCRLGGDTEARPERLEDGVPEPDASARPRR